MNRLNLLVGTGFAFAVLAAVPSFAGDNNGNNKHPYSSFAESRTGYNTKAKVALHWGDDSVLQSKNVTKVTNPSAGIICIFPSVAINENTNYPHLSVEWGRSSGDNLIAFLDIDWPDCIGTPYEVRTYNFSGKSVMTLADGVAFEFTIE